MIEEKAAEYAAEKIARFGRNTVLYGPPGVGKTMIARRVVKYLPPLTREEAVEIAWLYSTARLPPPGTSYVRGGWEFDIRRPQGIERPFRAPHHTASYAALVGTNRSPVGEVSLAHRGVLYLDDLPEFSRMAVDGVAQALKAGCVMHGGFCVPSKFTLLASVLPCPCGWYGSTVRACTCSDQAVQRHRDRATKLTQTFGCMDLWVVSERHTSLIWENATC